MGFMSHNAIIVTSWEPEHLAIAHAKATEVFEQCHMEQLVSPAVGSIINGYHSFFVAPDGSKEGWVASGDGDRCRDEFVAWMASVADDVYLSWAEVQYGNDDRISLLVRSEADVDASDA